MVGLGPRYSSVRKIVLPISGSSCRLLPTTKTLPKEMLPLGKHPIIQHIFDEMVISNLEEFLFISSRNTNIIANHFDSNLDLVCHAEKTGGRQDSGNLDYAGCSISFFQSRHHLSSDISIPAGICTAVCSAESFVNNEHFVVACSDTLIKSERRPNLTHRMIDVHLKYKAACTVGILLVPSEIYSKHGIVYPASGEDLNAEGFLLDDIVQQPYLDRAPSRLAVSGRYVFAPEIFHEIRKLALNNGSEFGINDAIRGLIHSRHVVHGVRMHPDEARFVIDSHESYYKAFIDFARTDPECGVAIQHYITTCV
ncbi:MAG: sugar phosphate nucleotidyltransferase [Gemmatimonadota bacterium]|nr:sugar phosphate nucleotidyltransferase [Gemmatimonadota bacterium]